MEQINFKLSHNSKTKTKMESTTTTTNVNRSDTHADNQKHKSIDEHPNTNTKTKNNNLSSHCSCSKCSSSRKSHQHHHRKVSNPLIILLGYAIIALALNPVMECVASVGTSSSAVEEHSHQHHRHGGQQHHRHHHKEVMETSTSSDINSKRNSINGKSVGSVDSDSSEYGDDYLDEDTEDYKEQHQRHAHAHTHTHTHQVKVEDSHTRHHQIKVEDSMSYYGLVGPSHTQRVMLNSTTQTMKCDACRIRDQIKERSLDAIKNHILTKLSMFNRSNTPERLQKVPQDIIEQFCKNECVGSRCECFPDKGRRKDNSYDYMKDEGLQGDDPFAGGSRNNHDQDSDAREIIEEEDDDYFAIANTIYVFPEQNEANYRPNEYLNFSFEPQDNYVVADAKLNVYLRSEKWLRRNDREAFDKLNGNKLIDIEIQMNSTHLNKTMGRKFSNLTLPDGDGGRYVKLDMRQTVLKWFQHSNNPINHGIIVKVFRAGTKNAIQRVAAINRNGDVNSGEITPFIEVQLKDSSKRRTKRSASLDCNEETSETRCCRYPLTVDFEKFGWDWVIAPKRYDANYCSVQYSLQYNSEHDCREMFVLIKKKKANMVIRHAVQSRQSSTSVIVGFSDYRD